MLAGGRLTVCTQCAARRDLTEDQLVDGAVIKGAAVFVEEVMADGRAGPRLLSNPADVASRPAAGGKTWPLDG